MGPNLNTVKFGQLTQINPAKLNNTLALKPKTAPPTFANAVNENNTDGFVASSQKEIPTISGMPSNVSAMLGKYANQDRTLAGPGPSFLAATGNTLRTVIGGDKKPKSSFELGDEATQVA